MREQKFYQLTVSEKQFGTICGALNHSKLTLDSETVRAEIEAVLDYIFRTARLTAKPQDFASR